MSGSAGPPTPEGSSNGNTRSGGRVLLEACLAVVASASVLYVVVQLVGPVWIEIVIAGLLLLVLVAVCLWLTGRRDLW